MTRLLLAAILACFPHFRARHEIVRRFDAIAAAAHDASERHGVPPAILISVGFHETHLGVDEPDWGAPADRRHRHTAGTPDDAARALASGYRACHSWRGAVSRFRSGLCTPPPFARGYVASVMRLSQRLYARASASP